MKPIGGWERLAALVLPAPPHERLPRPRPQPRRLANLTLTVAAAPVSAAGRLWLKLSGRTRSLDPAGLKSIAFLKLDHLGDVVQATPLLRALKAWAPAARLTVYTRPANVEALLRLSYVDEVEGVDVPWIRPETSWGENLKACLALAANVRQRAFDLAVDLRYHNRMDSLLLSLCGARARLGFDAGGCGFWLTHRAPWPREGHEVERGAAALRWFGIPVSDLTPEFPLSLPSSPSGERGKGRIWVAPGKKFVVVHTGAGNAIKRWMPERFAWVGRELARRARVTVAVLSGPGEEAGGEPLARALPAVSLLDLRGRLKLPEMAALIKRAALFIGNDGGAAHVAAAVGAPTLIVFSGTNLAAQWAPRGRHVRVIEQWVPCKPCHSTTCPFEQACLREVTVDQVLAAALSMLR